MKYLDPETLRFRQWRTINGRAESVDVIRRNGQLAHRYVPEYSRMEERPEMHQLLRELMYGLTVTERRTWLLLLLHIPIEEIAEREHVSSSAIYERIRGNSKGQGGMIRKNDYVHIWWRDQRRHPTND